MNANKVIPENLVVVSYLWLYKHHIDKFVEDSTTVLPNYPLRMVALQIYGGE